MLVIIEQSVLTDFYKLKTEIKILLDELEGYLSDPPLVYNWRLSDSVKRIEKLTCEGTNHG